MLPESILAVALYHEGVHYGALWVGYEKPHTFTTDERRFLNAVAGQAALAASKRPTVFFCPAWPPTHGSYFGIDA